MGSAATSFRARRRAIWMSCCAPPGIRTADSGLCRIGWYRVGARVALDHSVSETSRCGTRPRRIPRGARDVDRKQVAGDSAWFSPRAEYLQIGGRCASRLTEMRDASQIGSNGSAGGPPCCRARPEGTGGGLRDDVVMRALVATCHRSPHASPRKLRSALLDGVTLSTHVGDDRRNWILSG